MWLYLLGGALVLIGLVGSLAGGGIFTLVLIPVGLVVLGSAMAYGMFQRAGERSGGGDTDAHPSTGEPLPHSARGDTGHVPTSPEALADARRVQQ